VAPAPEAAPPALRFSAMGAAVSRVARSEQRVGAVSAFDRATCPQVASRDSAWRGCVPADACCSHPRQEDATRAVRPRAACSAAPSAVWPGQPPLRHEAASRARRSARRPRSAERVAPPNGPAPCRTGDPATGKRRLARRCPHRRPPHQRHPAPVPRSTSAHPHHPPASRRCSRAQALGRARPCRRSSKWLPSPQRGATGDAGPHKFSATTRLRGTRSSAVDRARRRVLAHLHRRGCGRDANAEQACRSSSVAGVCLRAAETLASRR
jgi:hypothetical protein